MKPSQILRNVNNLKYPAHSFIMSGGYTFTICMYRIQFGYMVTMVAENGAPLSPGIGRTKKDAWRNAMSILKDYIIHRSRS